MSSLPAQDWEYTGGEGELVYEFRGSRTGETVKRVQVTTFKEGVGKSLVKWFLFSGGEKMAELEGEESGYLEGKFEEWSKARSKMGLI